MAALSISQYSLPTKKSSLQEHNYKYRNSPRILISLSCQSRELISTPSTTLKTKRENKEDKLSLSRILVAMEKMGKGLKENLSPKQKGDWKDLMLMSLSFAVYVYIAQKIVCAYCAWTYMLKQPW